MIIEIDFNSDEAIYQQLCNQIILEIATSHLREGDSLPSVRALAEEVGVNMHTVNKAYTVLKNEGFLAVDRRRGAILLLKIWQVNLLILNMVDKEKMRALQDLRNDLTIALARANCKNITIDEVHALIDEICEEYK